LELSPSLVSSQAHWGLSIPWFSEILTSLLPHWFFCSTTLSPLNATLRDY
jgi:hypothetical protein